jgi:hypothetical protein
MSKTLKQSQGQSTPAAPSVPERGNGLTVWQP